VALRNTGGQPMPAGIGHHPYLPHRREQGGTRVQAGVRAVWETDAECLPTGLVPDHPAVAALRAGARLADWVLDHNFSGFEGAARVSWPDGSGLRLRADPVLGVFVLYSPAARDHFVMEAVSNATDWLNLRAADPRSPAGGTFLAPGEALRAVTLLEPLPAD
jgi:aldose 1-epimerase